jgi:hypothetical protein
MAQIRTVSAFVVSFTLCAGMASAQLHEVRRSTLPSFGVGFASGASYDPIHDCYFVVSGVGSVTGRFINRDGAIIRAVSLDPRAGFADVAYSPDIPDGAGGMGGFLTIWTLQGLPGLFGQIVTLPAGLVGPLITIRPTHPSAFEFKGGVAYSPVDHVFLIAVGVTDAGGSLPTRIVRLNQNAQPLADVQLSFEPSFSCPNLEFSLGCNEVDVVWNPISSEFGVLYNQGREKTLARVSGNGAILSRIALGISRAWGALSVNTATGSYLAVGGLGSSSLDGPQLADAAEVSPGGAVVARGFVTSSLETDASDTGWMRLSYSAISGTFLLAGLGTDHRSRLLELNQHGVPTGAVLVLGQFFPTISSHGVAPHWLAAAADARYIIGTSTPFGGSDAILDGCITPDPFVAFGGGTCVNRGWFPPGVILPPSPAGCTTPDPFVALGGGTCVNGGWYPPAVPAPLPPPPPVSGGCITPDPFVALGGGTCVSGGWYPPVVAAPPAPAPVPGGCLTPDPFVAFGGGRCIDGGWYPPGS